MRRISVYAPIAVVERTSFQITVGDSKAKNFDTKPTCHRKYRQDCGCHMYSEVDAFPELVLVLAPTLERGQDVGTPPGRWVFTEARHPMFQIPDDGLPKYPG